MLRRRNLICTLISGALLGGVLAAGALGANTTLVADLKGNKEVPGPGDPNGKATAEVTLKPKRKRVCFEIEFKRIEAPAAGHIHKGGKSVAGPVKVTLFERPNGASSPVEGCAKNVKRKLIRRIRRHPGGWYVNLHNAEFPDGAIRGQLKKED